METKKISTRMKNLMKGYIGKKYNYFYGRYAFIWVVKIIGITEYGRFVTEINDGSDTWQSNASYGEVVSNIKKGLFVES